MSSTELAGGSHSPEQNPECLKEQTEACKGFKQEQVSLHETIDTSFLSLPEHAQSYLRENCQSATHMSLAAREAALLLAENPNILDDTFEAEMELDDCIEKSEIAALDEKIEEGRTANEVLSNEFQQMAREEFERGGNIDDKLKRIEVAFSDEEVALKQIAIFRKTLMDLRGTIEDPQEQAAFEAILASAPIDLAASDVGTMFAPVLGEIDKSDAFSTETKTRLRNIVTGTDVQDTLAKKNADGSFANTEDNKREIRAGVSGYAEPSGRQIIEARSGDHIVTKDVTGWSGEDVGLLVEVMHYWNMTESFGTTGFVENIYKIDFSLLDGGGAFDPLTVNRFRQVISHMTGGFKGYDGDIENFEHQQRLIQNQSRLLSDTQTAFGWENNQSGTTQVLQRLGLENADGHPNLEVIAAFGDYTQENYATGQSDQLGVVDYLTRLYPQYVAPITETERNDHRLDV